MRKYSIIYADPPWQFNSVKTGGSMKSGAAAKYPVMTLEQLKALDVAAICEKDCVLIMWYVSSQPQEALDLAKAWGFTVKNMNGFIWRKLSTNLIPHFGMGYWTRGGAECALIAVRGKPKAECRSIRQVRDEVVGEHSEKPAIFRDDIVKLCGDLPRLEMFARHTPPGWDVWGNEVDSAVELSGNSGELPEHIADDGKMVGTDIDDGTRPCISESAENETQTDLNDQDSQQTHNWPVEVVEAVNEAFSRTINSSATEYRGLLCESANKMILNGTRPSLVANRLLWLIDGLQEMENKSCAA